MPKSTCSECERPIYARGWCSSHYGKNRRAGTLNSGPLTHLPRGKCIKPGCDELRHVSAGYCSKHYRRLVRHGDPDGGQRYRYPHGATLREAFDFFTPSEPPEPGVPWLWQGSVNAAGYGTLSHGNVSYYAHRLSYEFFVEPISDGLIIRHKNDWPLDICPFNLETGTDADNCQDKIDRNRHSHGESHGMAVVTDAVVREIRYRRNELGERRTVIAEAFGVSVNTVTSIANRKTWRHVL